jgi:hypothetical protein
MERIDDGCTLEKKSTGDGQGSCWQIAGCSQHAFMHRPQITGAGHRFLFKTFAQNAEEKRFGEERRQFGTRLPVTALAAIEPDGQRGGPRSRRVAVHQGGELFVGQPDLWHAGSLLVRGHVHVQF